jgi:hypothetical protein
MGRAPLAIMSLAALVACAAPSIKETPRPSLAETLSRATGRHVRVERDGEHWLGFADEVPPAGPLAGRSLAEVDRRGGDERARAIFDAACTVLDIDPSMLGPTLWAEHPKPTACAPQLWPGTREPTTHGLCVAFDVGHRPLWIDIHWSAAIAARHDRLADRRAILAALERRAPADVVWAHESWLSLEAGRPVYRFQSTSGESIDTHTVDAVTGTLIEVRVARFAAPR